MINRSKGTQACLERWKAAFATAYKRVGRALPDRERHWEAMQVFDELRKVESLDAVALRNARNRTWRTKDLISRIAEEVKIYEDHAGKIRQIRLEFEATREAYDKAIGLLEKRAQSCTVPELRRISKQSAAYVQLDAQDVMRTQESYWTKPRGVLRTLLRESGGREPEREIDLDGRFQRRVAVLFQMFLPEELSLRTVARLVVLTYIAADLAEDRDGVLQTKHTEIQISVQSVEQKLRRAKAEAKARTTS